MDDEAADGWVLLKRESACVSWPLGSVARKRDDPKQIRTRSTTGIWPYPAKLEPTHHGDDYQIGFVVRTDEDY